MMSDCCDGFAIPIGVYAEPSKTNNRKKVNTYNERVTLTTTWVNKEKELAVDFDDRQFEPLLIENPSIMSLEGSLISYRGIEFEYQRQQFKLI